MINHNNIELAFQVLDDIVDIFVKEQDLDYLNGLVRACELITQGEILSGEVPARELELRNLLDRISDVEFQKEEIRKAFQLQVLKGMKIMNLANENMTPDTIGVFIAYLVRKFMPDARKLTIMDPLTGTGNLLVTVANNLEIDTILIGVENESDRYRLSRALVGMCDYNDDIYFQDTLDFNNVSADVIITDFPYGNESDEIYFPHSVLIHHEANLVKGGYVFALVAQEFFDSEKNPDFKNKILDLYLAIGLIKLPDEIFRIQGKSILILKKKIDPSDLNENFLIAEIPSFEEQDEMRKVINRINSWFENTIKRG
ncbi:MAG: N-6 DNA methylase [Bacilli bacterium]|nr:N-6 DNA methylase [Bacilli bacterium]MBN2696379.1 N-6 DNA methylase [Bacilli bacterium]